MSTLNNKIDFAVIISVRNANPNGDPAYGDRPRTDYCGYGEISDVCIKHKIRNRMQDMGEKIFVQSDERCDDGFDSLSTRASKTIVGIKDSNEYARLACETWADVRSFGQVFAFKSKKDGESGDSVGVRGPVSVHQAVSCSQVLVNSMKITKCVNSEPAKKKSSDTMGTKHLIDFGLYVVKGSINCQLAEKTGFSEQDAELIKESLRTLFMNDSSSARPDGSMEVCRLYWWRHNCKDGQYSSAKVHRLLKIEKKDDVKNPKSIDDYIVTLDTLDGLQCEEIDGM